MREEEKVLPCHTQAAVGSLAALGQAGMWLFITELHHLPVSLAAVSWVTSRLPLLLREEVQVEML